MKHWLLALFWLLLVASGLTPRVAAHQLATPPADAVSSTPVTLRRHQPVLLPPAALSEPHGLVPHQSDYHPLLLDLAQRQPGAFSLPLTECVGFSSSHGAVARDALASTTPSRAPPAL